MEPFDNFNFKEVLKIVARNYLNSYKRQLLTFSDETILRKLETTKSEVYEVTYREAKRRGLV